MTISFLARQAWVCITHFRRDPFTSNYVLLETTALLQHRFGIEAVRLFQNDILPVVEAVWVDEAIHAQALSALLVANRRRLSLVDCSSFELMHRLGLELAFTFDPHFREQGFTVVPDSIELSLPCRVIGRAV